jgi:hypothetical protein
MSVKGMVEKSVGANFGVGTTRPGAIGFFLNSSHLILAASAASALVTSACCAFAELT